MAPKPTAQTKTSKIVATTFAVAELPIHASREALAVSLPFWVEEAAGRVEVLVLVLELVCVRLVTSVAPVFMSRESRG